ncbi:MFS transporter, PPP family, 3-phenylpropionic acid transporter [Bradyrhizobium brasilense]|uniref:MFS transporter, PPP family, 3-phenylpropionic acid transporter n=1 Tax=Bradyrhizobium brasilense TaxID=1419277 RepID=A0A1G7K6L4_9BRAD|nr:MFS transporter [Bradyrhizobium brasilense]SDF32776.1 MFS transporter, PPP family, 3-phenylpropionic acid transporter [Bradyrhizobium brasilense]
MRINGPIAYIALYVALYAAFGAASPYWPKFFETRALTPQQIGSILAAAILVRLVSGPCVGRLADVFGSLRLVFASCAALAAGMALALIWADRSWLLLLLTLAQAAALAPTTSIADALSVNAAKPQIAGKPFEYGWIRGSASAAFVLGTLLVGQLIGPGDLTPIIWINATLLIAAACATALVPAVTTQVTPNTEQSLAARKVHGLFSIRRFRILIFVSALVYGSHAMHDAFAVIRWSNAGIGTSVISILWSEAVAAEVFVFFLVGPALIDRFGVHGAATLAAAAGIIRWLIAGVTTSVVLLSIIQPLHGLTFALLHLACMRMMGTLVPIRLAATAQALYAFSAGVVTAALTSLSGILYARYAGAAFFPMAALCVVALPFAWFGFVGEGRDRSVSFL